MCPILTHQGLDRKKLLKRWGIASVCNGFEVYLRMKKAQRDALIHIVRLVIIVFSFVFAEGYLCQIENLSPCGLCQPCSIVDIFWKSHLLGKDMSDGLDFKSSGSCLILPFPHDQTVPGLVLQWKLTPCIYKKENSEQRPFHSTPNGLTVLQLTMQHFCPSVSKTSTYQFCSKLVTGTVSPFITLRSILDKAMCLNNGGLYLWGDKTQKIVWAGSILSSWKRESICYI